MEFLGIIIFLILVYIRPQDFMPELENWRPVLVVMFVTVFLWILKRLKFAEKKLFLFPLDYSVILLALAMLVSTYHVQYLGFVFSSAFELLKVVLFYFVIADVVNNERKLKLFINIFAFLTLLITFIAILQIFGIDLLKVGMLHGRIQGAGIFNNPNYLAYYISIAFPVFFHQLAKEKGFMLRLFCLLGIIISCWAVFLTKSRGGAICFIFAILFCFVQGKKLWMKNTFLAVGIFIFVSSVSFLPRLATLSRGDASIQDRIEAWYSGWHMLKEHPFIGVGLGEFDNWHKGKGAHSVFVRLAAESGLFGLICWCVMIFALFKILMGTYCCNKAYKKYYLILEASVWTYLFTSFTAELAMIIYILSGMTGALARINLSYQNAYVKTINNDERLPIINKINNSLNLGKLDYLKITFFTLLLLLAWHLTIRFRFK